MHKYVVLLLIIILPIFLSGQNHNIKFEHISVEHGLSNGTVYSISQDKKGFMWFGTSDGLNKFDGYNFTYYKHDLLNPNSISNNNAGNLFIDKQGIIWIGTWGGGLNKFNPETEQFTVFLHVPDDSASISDNRVQSIFQDSSGTLWFGTYQNGLNKLIYGKGKNSDRQTEQFLHYLHDLNNPDSLSNGRIWDILECRDRKLWIATSKGLNCFDPETESFIHYFHDPANPYSISNSVIRTLFRSHSGILWAGTQNGLNRFDPETKRFIRFFYDPKQKNMFGKNTINTIAEDPTGILWVGTSNGLCSLDPQTGIFTRFIHDAKNPHSLSTNEVRRIYVDPAGNIWIGTSGRGINKFNYRPKKFDHYYHDPNNVNSLSNNYVRAIFEDSSGVLWIGTRNGLNRLITEETSDTGRSLQKFKHFKYDPEYPGSLSHNEVWCIYEDRSNVLWIGTRSGGLNRFDRVTEKFKHYLHDHSNPDSLSRMGVLSIYEDSSANLWIGAYAGGLYKFNRSREEFNRYQNDPDNPDSISHNEVWCIFEDSSENLWIGTGNGLNKFNRDTEEFSRFYYSLGNKDRQQINRVFYIYEDKKGILWVGTDWGLHRFDRSTGKFTAFFEKDGLPNNRILGGLPDSEGNLWLSTNRGISQFDPQARTFKNFDVDDGLQSKEFTPRAFFKSSDGKMYFGGVNGFNSFYPDEIIDNPYIPPVVITDFKIFEKSVKPGKVSPPGKSVSETDEIVLSYKDYVFSFDFASLDFVYPEKNKYKYKLENFDKHWISTDASRRTAHYANLSPGNYIFRVIGSNNDGVWNKKGISIKVTIIPPIWETLWFRLIGLFLICVVIYIFFRLNTSQIRHRAKILKHEVDKSTKELQSSEEKYRTMIENSNDMIWTLDEKGDFLYANRKSQEITGYNIEKEPDKSFIPIIVPEDLEKVQKVFIETLKGKSQHYEARVYNKKMQILFLSVNTAPILKEGKVVGTISFGRDITEKRKMEDELVKADKIESIGILAGGIAHDFNNILTGIIGNISLTKEYSSPEGRVYNSLIKIEKASMQAKVLIQQLLTFAKGGTPIKKTIFIKNLIRDAAIFSTRGSRIRCEFSIRDDLWPVEVDRGQIVQVINNLVINASQAMTGGGVINISADNIDIDTDQIFQFRKGKYIKISIKDKGTGIAEDNIKKIFDPYFTTKQKGNGLGLSITYSIIKRHKGYITVESDLDAGTTFFIYLPASLEDKVADDQENRGTLIAGKGRVLVLDDNKAVGDVACEMLEYIGYKAVFTENGNDAVEIYTKAEESGNPFSVVLLDLTIPGGMGGEETLKKLIEIDPAVKGIVSSGYSNDPIMADFRKYGFAGVISKPYRIKQLSEILYNVIRSG